MSCTNCGNGSCHYRPTPPITEWLQQPAARGGGGGPGGTALLETLDYVRHAMIGLAMLYMYA